MSTTTETPAMASIGQFQVVHLNLLKEHPLNPRRHFDAARLEELAASIKEKGVLNPLLVRPGNGGTKVQGYEILAGARRYRASREAGLAEVPVLIRDLDDKAALELMVVDNLQREDVHPLEEADGYRQLHEEHGYSIDDLAVKVGKSKAYVYARMKLTALKDKAARDAFLKGEISPSVALLVARIPNEKLQREFATKVLKGRWQHDPEAPLSYRVALDLYHHEFMLRLDDAPWKKDDAQLVPEAGACTTCPKRTGNQGELFADVKSADVCTDTSCFKAKKEAWTGARLAELRNEGRAVIDGKKAKEIMPYPGSFYAGFVSLDSREYRDPKDRTYRQLLEKPLREDVSAQPAVVVSPHDGTLHDVMDQKTANRLLREAGHTWAKPQASSSSSRSSKASKPRTKQQKAEDDLAGQVEELLGAALLSEVVTAAEKDKASGKVLELLIVEGEGNYEVPGMLQRRGVKAVKAGMSAAAALTKAGLKEPQLRGLALEQAIRAEQDMFGNNDGRLMQAACTAYKVDRKKIEAGIRERLKAAAKAAEKTPAAKSAKKGQATASA